MNDVVRTCISRPPQGVRSVQDRRDRERDTAPMNIDFPAATDFMATHARILDRRRYERRDGRADSRAVLAALDGYGNPDGGYGWGLEPDLRSPESQPGAAHHAFEVMAEVGQAATEQAMALCDWLDSIALDDGGAPMALPLGLEAGSAPWWRGADPSASSLQITSITASSALRVAAADPAVAAHPWLERATEYCLGEIERTQGPPSAYVLAFSVRFLDALYESRPEDTERLLGGLAEFVPADGRIPVSGGTEGEALKPLDLAPHPGRPARTLFSDEIIEADLERLAALQHDDGGWVVEYARISPAGALDWRGYVTLGAVDVLRRNAV